MAEKHWKRFEKPETLFDSTFRGFYFNHYIRYRFYWDQNASSFVILSLQKIIYFPGYNECMFTMKQSILQVICLQIGGKGSNDPGPELSKCWHLLRKKSIKDSYMVNSQLSKGLAEKMLVIFYSKYSDD